MELNYVFGNPSKEIPLNLYEAERYENAVIIQQLVGNLVVYSNKGRYEPVIAERWEMENEKTWRFDLKPGFVCENGEKITPEAFKNSIEMSIKYLSKDSPVTVFSKMSGYKQFVKAESKQISGITTEGNSIRFHFDYPLRSGLIQVLSFAPFGFICSENRLEDGSWKDDNLFTSSGPYKITEHRPGIVHTLEKRPEWPIWTSSAPKAVHISYSFSNLKDQSLPAILDSFTVLDTVPPNVKRYRLVPEYLNPVIMYPNSKGKFFASLENRRALKTALEAQREALPLEFDNHTRSNFFYSTQPPAKIDDAEVVVAPPSYELVIQGKEPKAGERKYSAWYALKGALNSLGWKYKFDNTVKTFAELNRDTSDIQMRATSVGGGVEPWVVDSTFYSDLGPQYPDPSGRIKTLLKQHEIGVTSDSTFINEFNQAVYDDAAIVPISHFGVLMYISDKIKLESISPLLSIIRFNQLEIE